MKLFAIGFLVLSAVALSAPDLLAQKKKIKVSFSTHVRDGRQNNQLRVKISTDFSGVYTGEGIKKATWQDITDRFKFIESREYKPAGTADISDLINEGEPLYFAFEYINLKNSVFGKWRVWRVNSFLIREKKKELVNQSTAGWKPVTIGPWQKGRGVIIGKTSIAFNGNKDFKNESDIKVAWAISKPLYLVTK